jgi:hypothetical protein
MTTRTRGTVSSGFASSTGFPGGRARHAAALLDDGRRSRLPTGGTDVLLAEPSTVGEITRPATHRARPPERGRWHRLAATWELWGILAAQLALTVPWLWRTAPFTDEALYLEAGRQEWAHWLHHVPIAHYPGWFSGAPVIYPPLAAVANSADGLAAARALSLVFMLASTALIYVTARRLFSDRLAGVLAALLFAVCGLVVHYGAFATFGPAAMFLLVVATWAAMRVRDGSPLWLAACAMSLVAADATKYAALAWDPVVIGVVLLHGWDKARWRALGDAVSVGLTVGVLGIGLVMLGGADYSRGIIVTTIYRSIHWNQPSSAASVLLRALAMTGVLVIPAIAGVIVALIRGEPATRTLLLALLAFGAVFAAADQARIHQMTSLDKNLGFSLPFAALGAGYALSAARDWLTRHCRWGNELAIVACVALVLGTVIAGRLQSVQFRGPGVQTAAEVVDAVRTDYVPGTYILSDGAARMEQYYLPSIQSRWWVGTFNPTPQQNARISAMVCSGQISVVVLRKSGSDYDHPYDLKILQMLARAGSYRVGTVASQGTYSTQVWKLADPSRTSGNDAQGCQ